jgi:glycosyltransferase involved in cell wall biosynthesis
MNELRVQCVLKRWQHLSASGGYEQLARAVGAEVISRRLRRRTILHRVERGLWRGLTHPKPYMLDYRYEDWLVELRVLCRSWLHPPNVVHVLYGDEELDLLLRHRRLLPCPLVASFHLPPNRVRERFEVTQKHLLSGIDVAVVVAKNQLRPFSNWLGPDRVVYIPHGIDTDQFCPGECLPRRECVRLITVGHHMRDWKAIDEIIAQCVAQRLPVRFDIVTAHHGLSSSANLPNVHFHSRISEEDLIRLYREADALLLPVLDATANNAVLEALACGTPVISTMVGGIPDYVDNTCGWLFESSEVAGIVNLISEICDEREIASSRRSAARNKALVFSWERVAAKMRVVYAAVARHRCLGTSSLEWE